MKNYVQAAQVVEVTIPADVASGGFVAVGAIFGFAQAAYAAGDLGNIVTDGAYMTSVEATADVAAGDVIYAAGQTLTTDDNAGANPRCGIAIEGGATDGTSAEIVMKVNA